MKNLSLILLPIITLILVGCDAAQSNNASIPEPVETWYELSINEVLFEVQIAVIPSEQNKGLMHRDSLASNKGMLFPYKSPQQMSFWMANTKIPLDIGFFDPDGVLLEVHRMYPNSTTPTRSSSSNIQYALEMNQGWFRQNNIKVGATLDQEKLSQALSKRGHQQ